MNGLKLMLRLLAIGSVEGIWNKADSKKKKKKKKNQCNSAMPILKIQKGSVSLIALIYTQMNYCACFKFFWVWKCKQLRV